jgi:hypothetical protein
MRVVCMIDDFSSIKHTVVSRRTDITRIDYSSDDLIANAAAFMTGYRSFIIADLT